MADGVDEGSAAMRGSLDAIKGVDAGPKAAERLFLGTSKHDGSPEPTAHLPNTVHAGCRSRESDTGTGNAIGRWIPASDMLPKEGESVIAVVLDRSRELCWNGRYWIYPASGEREDCGVAYWMPLPAPPADAK